MSIRHGFEREALKPRTLKQAKEEYPGLFSEFSGKRAEAKYAALKMRGGWSGHGFFCRAVPRDR